MKNKLSDYTKQLIKDPESVKLITVSGKDGTAHSAVKSSLKVNDDGYIEYLEYIETSVSNACMVWSLWFKKPVEITICKGPACVQIKGVPYRAVTSGRVFENNYRQVRKEGDFDLSAVWLIEPLSESDHSLEKRFHEEEKSFPGIRHLDRLVKSALSDK